MRGLNWVVAAALAFGAVPLASVSAQADEKGEHEKVVKLESIPAPARQTILKEAAGSPVIKVEEEHENGKVLYEAHVKKTDSVLGIRVDPSGKLIDKHSEKDEKK